MMLKENSQSIIDYLKENGGKASVTELATALDRSEKSINGTITSLGCKGPHAKGFVDYEKVEVEGEDKPVKYVFLTDAGKNFVPTPDEE